MEAFKVFLSPMSACQADFMYASLVKGSLADTSCTCSHWGTCLVKGTHGHLEASALPDENVLLGNDDVFEGDAPGVAGPLSHVDLLPAGSHAGGVAVHDEPSERLTSGALGVWVGSRQHEVVVGHTSVGDPHLLAVDHPLVALLLRLGLHSTHVAAGPGLGHTISTHQGLLDQSAQVLLLLLMVAGDHHRHGTKTVGLDGSHDTSAAIGHLLSDKTT